MIHNLFPTPVGLYALDRKLSATELSFIKNIERHNNTGNTTSDDRNVLENKKLKKLRTFIEEKLNEYFKQVHDPKHDVRLAITQSWCNYTEPGQFHHKHAHPNSYISGVFYVNADAEKDRIFFYKDGYQQLKLPPNDWNLWNSESWWFEAGTGGLVLFPSSLTHMVPNTESNETRISLSFNTFFEGQVGETNELTGLVIEGARG